MNRFTKPWCAVALSTAAVGSLAGNTHAAYVKAYDANAATPAPDPTSPEGGSWGLTGTSPTFPVKQAGADGTGNYWQVTDTNTNPTNGATANSSAGYVVQHSGAGADVNLASAFNDPNGWRLTTTLRVLDARVAAAGAGTAPLFLDIRSDADGVGTATGKIFTIGIFQNDPTYGDSIWWLPAGSSATGAGSSAIASDVDLGAVFHTIDMVLDRTVTPASTFRVLLDGVQIFSIAEAAANGSGAGRVQIMQAASGATHDVQYRSFTFQTIPEPATGAVLALAGAAGLGLRNRRRCL